MAFNTLNIGSSALLTQQRALDVVGQNIANSATPGYSRQRLSPQASRPQEFTFGVLGTGVEIQSIERIADEFLEKQVRLAKSTHDRLGAYQDGYENIEVFFNELTDNDLSTAMDGFWNAIGDFQNNVEDVSTRQALVDSAKTMRDSFKNMRDKLTDYRERMDETIQDTVDDVNSLTAQIADLNKDIVLMEKGGVTGVTANDLRDQRTERMKELAGLMDITVTEQDNGAVTVTQKSRLLVFEDKSFDLASKEVISDDMVIHQPVFADDEEDVSMEDGLLYGQVQMRDTIVQSYKKDVDELAASFMWEFNRIHTQNIGLEGFSSITATNAIDDATEFLDDLDYGFTPESGTFEIVNGNFEVIVHNEVSDKETTLNIEIDLDDNTADADTILYDPANPTASNALVNKLQAAFDTVQNGAFTVSVDLQNRMIITSNSDDYTFGFGRDTSGALAALGLNTFFTGHDSRTMDINSVVDSSPAMIAGAKGFTPGDNTGVLALQDLRNTRVMDNDTATLDDFYEGVVGRLGIEGSRIDSLLETQEDILTRMENQREDLSGVNMNEELTKMIQFQRAFQSAARFITTADTIYESLINM